MAAESSVVDSERISKHLTCSICLEIFEIPKTLSCLHTFCESCLDKHICKTGNPLLQNCFECPLCRTTISGKETLPKEQWARSFPTNHMVVSLLEDDSIRFPPKCQSKVKTVYNCKPCFIGETQTVAFGYCVNCKEYMCKNCCEEHKKFKSTKRHLVLQGDEFPEDTSGFEKVSELTHCTIHENEKIEYKCTQHHAFLCSICVTSSHRSCTGIEYIGNLVKHNGNMALDIPQLQQDIQRQIDANLSAVEKIGSFASDVGNQIADIKTDMQFLITQIEDIIECKLKSFAENERQKLTETLQKLFAVNDKLTQVNSVTNVTDKYGSELPTFILEGWVDGVRNEARKIEAIDSQDKLSALEKTVLDQVEELEDLISDKVLIKLSAMSSRTNFYKCQNNAQQPAREQSNAHSQKANPNYDEVFDVDSNETDAESVESIDLDNVSLMDCDISQVGRYDISLSEHASKPCCHNASLLLPDGEMIFTDRENKLVKVVTRDFHVKCYKTLADAPLDICLVNNGKIAVATTSSVIILDIRSNLEVPVMQSKVNTVRSLCLLKDEVWMLCADTDNKEDPTEFKVIIADSKLRRIDSRDTFSSWYGTETTLNQANLIRSRQKNEFIICKPREVKSFKLSGTERFYFRPSGLRHAVYVTFDVQNNLYVADIESGTIFQMANDSYRNYRTLIRGIPRPSSILFNHINQSLIIGCSHEDTVYEYLFT